MLTGVCDLVGYTVHVDGRCKEDELFGGFVQFFEVVFLLLLFLSCELELSGEELVVGCCFVGLARYAGRELLENHVIWASEGGSK